MGAGAELMIGVLWFGSVGICDAVEAVSSESL